MTPPRKGDVAPHVIARSRYTAALRAALNSRAPARTASATRLSGHGAADIVETSIDAAGKQLRTKGDMAALHKTDDVLKRLQEAVRAS